MVYVWASSTFYGSIKVITKLPNSEQSYKGKVKTHNYINRQNQSISVLSLMLANFEQAFDTVEWPFVG
jgi:hypothetical protein